MEFQDGPGAVAQRQSSGIRSDASRATVGEGSSPFRPPTADVDTTNDFLIGRRGKWTTMLLAPPGGAMTRDQALRLAAWLVVLSDCERHDFDLVFDAIRTT